ncbi:MAG: capsular biosynthesis protein [Bacillota bacterium]|nr:MAG: capsular biosynthesis protein [Bacillota bacterium]
MKKILITGAKGFVGKNLTVTLNAIKEGKDKTFPLSPDFELLCYDIDSDKSLLDEYCRECDFVVHLAGINRPQDPAEFMKGNFGFTDELLDTLAKYGSKAPVILSSSIQAELENDYGKSKKAGEERLFQYGEEHGVKVYVYRFPNLFGKWCRPNYNSVVATFCNNVARGIDIRVNDPKTELTLVYIDDIVRAIIELIAEDGAEESGYVFVHKEYRVTLGRIAELIMSFKASRETGLVPDLSDPFVKKLHATYTSYIPEREFSYPLTMHTDERGSFTEILRTAGAGQFSVNISKAGITKGEHWHHTKNEKFLVVSGRGVIRFRNIFSDEILEYYVSGDKLEVVDIPTGYTHNIENLGDTDMVTFMWCNECFNPERPDTYFLKVNEHE